MTAGLYVSKLNKVKEELKSIKMGIGVALGQIVAPRIEEHSVNQEMFIEMERMLKKSQGEAIKIAEELVADKKVDATSKSLLALDLENIVKTIRKMLKKLKLAEDLIKKEGPQDPEYEQTLTALWDDYLKLETYLPK